MAVYVTVHLHSGAAQTFRVRELTPAGDGLTLLGGAVPIPVRLQEVERLSFSTRRPARRPPPATRAERPWTPGEDARLLLDLLTGANLTQLAATVLRSEQAVRLHLRHRGWPTPATLSRHPELRAATQSVLRTLPDPVPPYNRVPHRAARFVFDAPPVLTQQQRDTLAQLPPDRRMRAWAKLAGLPVADHAQVPGIVRTLFARHAPAELREASDPISERQRCRRWALATGRFHGARGRVPAPVIREWVAAGKPEAPSPAGAATAAGSVAGPGAKPGVEGDRLLPSGSVAADAVGLLHLMFEPGRDVAVVTACGQRPQPTWTPRPELTWSRAGVRRCPRCRTLRRR